MLHRFWDYSQSQPSLCLNIAIGGFEDNGKVIKEVEQSMKQFLAYRFFGRVNISLDVNIIGLKEDFMTQFNGILEKPDDFLKDDVFTISPESPFYDLLHSKYSILSLNSKSKYTLFIINGKKDSLEFRYGGSKSQNQCFLLGMRASFCYVSLDARFAIPHIFRKINNFLDGFLPPEPQPSFHVPSSIVLSIVTFGPNINSAMLRTHMESVLPPSVDCHVLVTPKNLYEFPLIVAGLYSDSFSDLISSIKMSEHVLGVSAANAFETNSSQKIIPVFVFEKLDMYSYDSPVYSDNKMAAIFVENDDPMRLVLSAVSSFIPGLSDKPTISGHHPLYPAGGYSEFSPLISDSVMLSYILNDMHYTEDIFYEAQTVSEDIKKLDLSWINTSSIESLYPSLELSYKATINNINQNKLLQALTTVSTSRKVAEDILSSFKRLAQQSEIFSRCCPVSYYVAKPRSTISTIILVCGFLLMFGWSIYKFYMLYSQKKYSYIPKMLDF